MNRERLRALAVELIEATPLSAEQKRVAVEHSKIASDASLIYHLLSAGVMVGVSLLGPFVMFKLLNELVISVDAGIADGLEYRANRAANAKKN